MFYSNKKFNLFTVGKHGTTAIYDVVKKSILLAHHLLLTITPKVIASTTFVHMEDIEALIQGLFGETINIENANKDKIVRGSDGVSHVNGADIKKYFIENVPDSLVELFYAETKAYSTIRKEAAFFQD